MHMARVPPLLGFFWLRLHLLSPKLRSRDLRQEGLRGPHLGPESLWAGTAPLDQKIPGVLSRGARVASTSSPALYIPSLQVGIGMPSLLDCSVEVRWNDAPRSWGWTPVPSTVSQMSCSQFTWVKKTKNKDGSPSCFLLTCEASSRRALGSPPD